MRKFNAVLSISILVLFLIHMIVGSFQLFGFMPGGIAVMYAVTDTMLLGVVVHMVIGIKLTIDTLKAQKKAGVSYFRENALFWTRRISGFALMLFIAAHIVIFSGKGEGSGFRLNLFDVPQLLCSVLMVASLILHIVTNIRPLMIALGARSFGKFLADAGIVLSVVLLAAAAAFVVYFIRWSFP